MPARNVDAIILQIRGRPEYRAALDALREREGAANLSDLADRAFARLARRHGLTLPTRARPVGTNGSATARRPDLKPDLSPQV